MSGQHRAVITSIGEPTTDLCTWALERLGFEVELYIGSSPLSHKLQNIYTDYDTDFLRVDADVIVNRNVLKLVDEQPEAWWLQGKTFGWYSQDIIHGGVQLIRQPALQALRSHINSFLDAERPETEMFRLDEFHNPRRCLTSDLVCGIHGFGQDDLARVIAVKARRGQSANYDWELVERMNEFVK